MTDIVNNTTYQLRVSMDDLLNALSCESLLTEPPLDIIEDFSVNWVGLVQHVPKLKVRLAETITEVLSKYPTTI